MALNDRLNMILVLSEVITSLLYVTLPRSCRRCFLIYLLTIQWQAVEVKVTFNEISFEPSVFITSSFNNECPPRSGKMDFVGLIKSQKKSN